MNIKKLREYFDYSETSPSGLVYRVKSKNNKKKVGDFAGSITTKQDGSCPRWTVYLNGKPHNAARVIAILLGYDIEGYVIDHIDGNALNNKLENIRVVSCLENNRNKRKSKNNITGETGVFFESVTNKHGKLYEYFVAFYSGTQCVEIRKRFSINKLGKEKAFEEAKKFRKIGIENSTNYTERHGK